jgi:tetratricopeptide (TPR) repeat protein
MPLAAVIALALAVSPAESQRAAKIAHRSIIEYNASDFAKALADAKTAYEIDPRPALLFNLGQCYRALGDLKQALFSYRGFLREARDAPNRAAVVDLIQQLEAKLQAAAAPPPPQAPAAPLPVAAPPPAAPAPILVTVEPGSIQPEPAPAAAVSEGAPRRGLPAAFWWLGGSAVATGAAGTILGIVSHSALGSDQPKAVDGFQLHTISAGQYQTAQNEGLAADLLWGVGGVLLVSAVIVALTR